MFEWDDVDVIYQVPQFHIKKGTTVKVEVVLDSELSDFYKENLPYIINTWTFPNKGGYDKPFKLLDFTAFEKSFVTKIQFRKKDREQDELRLFCTDLMGVFNYNHTRVIKWECSLEGE